VSGTAWLVHGYANRAGQRSSVIRLAIGEKMVQGLEVFLACDIIQTIVVPTRESLAILGGIVVIRTMLVHFLNKELNQGARHSGG
jgi:uncharacterized membrane protein